MSAYSYLSSYSSSHSMLMVNGHYIKDYFKKLAITLTFKDKDVSSFSAIKVLTILNELEPEDSEQGQ